MRLLDAEWKDEASHSNVSLTVFRKDAEHCQSNTMSSIDLVFSASTTFSRVIWRRRESEFDRLIRSSEA